MTKITFFKNYTLPFLLIFLFTFSGLAQTGNALNFDGPTDYVLIPNSPSLSIAGSFTIEAWINPSNITNGNWPGIVDKYAGVSYFDEYALGIQLGKIWMEVTINGTSSYYTETPTNVLTANVWQHIAGVYNEALGTMSLYLNGVHVHTHSGITGTMVSSNNNITIGNLAWYGPGIYSGSIDEVRIWNIARTEAEIHDNMNSELSPQTGLAAVYHFNQGIANGDNTSPPINTAIDASGNDNTGTLVSFSLNGPISNWVGDGAPFGCDDFQVNLLDSDGNPLAGGSLEYREGGPNGWQVATEISDGVFCIDTERSRVGLRMTYSPQVLKVSKVPTNSDYTFQMENVTVELKDGGVLTDGGEVDYTSGSWHQFGSGTTGDDGTGIVTMDMLPTVYTFRMKFNGDKELKQEIISPSNNTITFNVEDLKSSLVDGNDDYQLAAYPNPFSGNTTIAFSLDAAKEVNIAVYDQTGRLIEVLHNGYQNVGNYKIVWDASNLNKGVYFVRLSSNGKVVHQNIVKM